MKYNFAKNVVDRYRPSMVKSIVVLFPTIIKPFENVKTKQAFVEISLFQQSAAFL